jgi:hypothetical protein
MVCAALAATEELDPPPELQAAAPAATATALTLTVTARHLLLGIAIPPHYGE